MKKSALVLLLIAAACLVFSGCSSNGSSKQVDPANKDAPDNFNAEGFPIVNEPITLTMFASRSAANGPYKDMFMFKEYEKKTNIKFEYNDVPSEGFDEKKNLVFGKKDLPDIFYKASISNDQLMKYGSSGALFPLEGLIKKYAPNIQSLFDQYPEVKKAVTTPDGHIYGMSSIIEPLVQRTNKLWINTKMLEEVNMDEPKTTDDLYNLLKAFKDKHPERTPFLTSSVQDLVNALGGSWGLYQQMGYRININDDKVHIWLTDDKYKEMLMYLNKLYKEGLIGHKVMDQEFAEYISQMQSGELGLFTNQATDAFPKVADQYKGITPIKGPHGDQGYNSSPIARDTGTFAISSSNKYPEASIRWIDYFYGDEGGMFFAHGVEGTTFNYDKDGIQQYTDEVKNLPKGTGSAFPWPGGGTPQHSTLKTAVHVNTPRDAEAASKIEPYVLKKVYPAPMFEENVSKKIFDLRDDLDTYTNESRAKFITGDLSFDSWDQYVSTVKDIGIEKLENYYQEAYDNQFK
ncbi:extracellular solute-binding protein [Paenibacillus dokdonensis]|uniref:Extracellular solute-binding protein n=1 Tax=Paenibacillus dokdonensis TaxID=2567944 RepID=A0ABU6GJS0_9BACL|nr:extracellular solute-binding protein [Paenibacillus dokdonensis]MEC0239985.1 extracellular solute-binding protein [Paenibacillus dokdonensis]